MLDQIIIGDIGSYDTYEASMKERVIGEPRKKVIKQTVPFSNKTHDFSKIDGELYWEERELDYIFEITADSPEALEDKKTAFKNWVMLVMEENLHDPFIPDFHFLATFDSIDFDDSEVEKTTATVVFTAYPYKIANRSELYSFAVSTAVQTVVISNNSSHRIVPTFTNSVPVTVQIGGASFSMPAGTIKDDVIMFAPGDNELKIAAVSTAGSLAIEFYEEVF